MNDGFKFKVNYICTRCCDCPNFYYPPEDSAYCSNLNANDSIAYRLDNDYHSNIHQDCPVRKSHHSS